MQLLDLKKSRKCTIFIQNSLVENLKAKVQNCDNFDNSHIISVSVQLATLLWSSSGDTIHKNINIWEYYLYVSKLLLSPHDRKILAKRKLHTSHNHMGLSYYPMRQIIIKLLANHKMLPNLYSTCANKSQKVW